MKEYLKEKPSISDITIKIQVILEKMNKIGFYLTSFLSISDLVVAFSEIKIQNASIFTIQKTEEKVSIDDAVLSIREEIMGIMEL